MPTTSLLILLVVAIWAAFLLQHWIRRREVVTTARSVDRFSEAMRVLAKRDPLPEGVAPMVRDLRGRDRRQAPEVSVKTPRTSLRAGQRTVGDEMVAPERTTAPAPGWRERVNGLAAGTGKGAASAVKGVKSLNGKQIRGISLLVVLALTVVTAVLAPFSLAPWWLPVVGLVATVGVVAWLRQSAIKERAARTAKPAPRRAPRPAVRSTGSAGQASRTPAPRRRTAPAAQRPAAPVEQPVATAPVEQDVAVEAASPAPYGFEEAAEQVVEQPVAQAPVEAEPTVAAYDQADGWAPVAVPPPTYTLKQRAPQSEVAPAGTVADQLQQIDDLPFDGLALDEDLEELPAVYRAG